jgi:hypothetical protein
MSPCSLMCLMCFASYKTVSAATDFLQPNPKQTFQPKTLQNHMQKPIGGRSAIGVFRSQSHVETTRRRICGTYAVSLYKGAINLGKSEHNYTAKTDGNVYYLSLSLLKDAKRKYNGTPKNSRPKTWFTRLSA